MNVEANYNWRGDLIGYRRENTYIPLDLGNRDYYEIQKAIMAGECTVNEPTLGLITKVYDRHGIHSGYHTSFGFVTCRTDNHILQLINQQVNDGKCTIMNATEKPSVDASSKISTLVFCIMLEQAWPHISAEFHGEMSYTSHKGKTIQKSFQFSLKSLPIEQPQSKVNLVLAHYKAEHSMPINFQLLQFGVIEIKVPVKELRWLFMGERALIKEWLSPFVEDQLAQHYAQTGRKPSEGPDIAWLINNASSYLGHFITEFSNRIIEAFRNEYGLAPVHYISEENDRNNLVVLAVADSGKVRLHNFMFAGTNSFNLLGEWHQASLIRFQEMSGTKDYHRKIALERVSDMLKLGFHAESLALINAFLEVTIKKTLNFYLRESSKHGLYKLGYGRCLEIIEKIAQTHSDKWMFDKKFFMLLKCVREIYNQRNLYVHALELDEHVGRLTVIKRRQIELLLKDFIDIHEQQQFLTRLDHIANSANESHFC